MGLRWEQKGPGEADTSIDTRGQVGHTLDAHAEQRHARIFALAGAAHLEAHVHDGLFDRGQKRKVTPINRVKRAS